MGKINLENFKSIALRQYEENKKFYTLFKKSNVKNLDKAMLQISKAAAKNYNCLDCANCCKSISPMINLRDITRIAKFLNLTQAAFIDTYLKIDEDGDYVFHNAPCPFLAEDNRCKIYEVRPKACAEYPHLEHVKFNKIAEISLKNTYVCPMVLYATNELKKFFSLTK